MSGTFTTRALCLKATPFADNDRVVTFFSRDRGVLRAMAKGVRREKSPLRGACEHLTVGQYQFAEGRNLAVLQQFQPEQAFSALRQELVALSTASVMADILLHLGDSDPPALFDALVDQFTALNAGGDPVPGLLTFASTVLESAGLAPHLSTCAHCHEALNPDTLRHPFSVPWGGPLCQRCRADHHVVPVSASTLHALENPTQAPPEPARVLRFLHFYFSQKAEQPFKTFQFLIQLLEA
jgi:DNA repair protein RecO (recombination protein O)